MAALAVTNCTAVASPAELYTTLGPLHVNAAGWAKPEPSLWPAPRQSLQPALWPWETCKAALHATGRLVSTKFGCLGWGSKTHERF